MKRYLLVGIMAVMAVSARAQQPAGHHRRHVRTGDQVEMVTFGPREAAIAHRFGIRLAVRGLSPGQAEAEIWRQAWEYYPGERFFARAFAQEAEEAYNRAVGAQ